MDRHREIERLDAIAHWLDSRFHVPGTNIRFGLDSILGLAPFVGDAAMALPAVYLIARAHLLGAPKTVIARMMMNTGIDFVIGAIPIVGDLFDLSFKANRRNIALLQRHLRTAAARPAPNA